MFHLLPFSEHKKKKLTKYVSHWEIALLQSGVLSMTAKKHCPTTHEIEIGRTLTNFVRQCSGGGLFAVVADLSCGFGVFMQMAAAF